VFKCDPVDPDLLVEQGEDIDPDPRHLCGGKVHFPVADVHVFHCQAQGREDVHAHATANFYVHPRYARGGRFDPGLVGVDVQKKEQGDRNEDQQPDECADGEANGF